jgi:hypothetical protein
MTVAMELSVAAEWRDRVLELRDVAEHTEDPHLRYKLFSLADRWELFAEELRDSALSAAPPAVAQQPRKPVRAG